MAENINSPVLRDVSYDAGVECPMCREAVPVVAVVEVVSSDPKITKTENEFVVVDIDFESKILYFRIMHECTYIRDKQ